MATAREHFRLDFLESDRPILIISGNSYRVMDISEGGCRFTGEPLFPDDAEINGTIKFGDGTMCEIAGKIIRSDLAKREAIAMLTTKVPFPKMMEEHRRLIAKYKK